MKHGPARPDYECIQDPSGKIPDDEPVFLIRGQDICGPLAVEAWARLTESFGAGSNIVRAARTQAERMRQFQVQTQRHKTPDMP